MDTGSLHLALRHFGTIEVYTASSSLQFETILNGHHGSRPSDLASEFKLHEVESTTGSGHARPKGKGSS